MSLREPEKLGGPGPVPARVGQRRLDEGALDGGLRLSRARGTTEAMSKATPKSFEVTCPCCQARLTVDPEVRAVIAHAPPPKTGPAASLDQAMAALRSAEARREARFREAAEAEKGKDQVLARKFAAGLERAKDMPDRPLRPIDLD